MEAIALMFATEMAIAFLGVGEMRSLCGFVRKAIAQPKLRIRLQPSHQIIQTRKVQWCLS